MTNQEALRIKYFLEAMIDFHGKNTAKDGESVSDYQLRSEARSIGLSNLSVYALDLLGEITWPDDEKVAA